MNKLIAIGALGLALALAAPVQAGGGTASFRILTSGDFGAVALSSYCPNTGDAYDPANMDPTNPGDPLDAEPGTLLYFVFNVDCFALKTNLGYDGSTGAAWCTAPDPEDTLCAAATDHLGHDFTCAVTNSATPGLESITVGFDTDDNGVIDISYPNTVYRPLEDNGVHDHTLANDEGYATNSGHGGIDLPNDPTGVPEVDNNVRNGINDGLRDGFIITGVIRGGFWPVVSGTIDGDFSVIFDHLGEDLLIDCEY